MAPAPVLDRINSLLEDNGQMLINERGLVDGQAYVVAPHKNFRMFLCYDYKFGDVSRALRNRCLEICVESCDNYWDFVKLSKG